MSESQKHSSARLIKAPWGSMPPRMRVLYITTRERTGAWLAESFASDSVSQVTLEEAVGVSAGVARLREEVFDAVLLSHDAACLDALEFLEGLRAADADEPVVVLGMESEQELAAICYEVGADAYLCVNTATTRTLIWTIARAVERRQLIRENRRLSQAERQRWQQEHAETQRLLEQQRTLVRDLEALGRDEADLDVGQPAAEMPPARSAADLALPHLPPQLQAHYRELLRAYVIMGSGNLAAEMSTLAELLVNAGVTARQAMQLHLLAAEELVRGLGNRSTRHVLIRSDLLVLEVMMHLAEGYRARYDHWLHPPRQRTLPGFGLPPDREVLSAAGAA